VYVVCGDNDLLEEPPCLVLPQTASLQNVIKHIPAFRVLHHDANMNICQDHLFETNDVRMDEPAVIQNLPLHILAHLLPSVQKFDRAFLPCTPFP
jgi:hypothetical protein